MPGLDDGVSAVDGWMGSYECGLATGGNAFICSVAVSQNEIIFMHALMVIRNTQLNGFPTLETVNTTRKRTQISICASTTV